MAANPPQKDSLEAYFDSISDGKPASATVPAQYEESSDHSDSDAEKRLLSFVPPEENERNEEGKDNEGEPQYVLPPDHSSMKYPPRKEQYSFARLNEAVAATSDNVSVSWRENNDVFLTNSASHPIFSFDPFIYELPAIAPFFLKQKINSPTIIQSQSIPIIFNGNNIIVVSPTGTGKTLCFLLPLIFHIYAQRNLNPTMCGPVALIISPTELLAHQTFSVFRDLSADLQIRAALLTSGNLKFKQESSLTKGADVIIATPGRLIHFLKPIEWRFCTYLVIDEADKIFEEGFFRQLRSIVEYIRPDRQTLLFGATLPKEIEELMKNSMKLPVRVQIGRVGAPQSNIEHIFVCFENPQAKREWLKSNILQMPDGLVLIFVKSRDFCEKLCKILLEVSKSVGFVHGSMPQNERAETFNLFKEGKIRFLLATEIAARGIDIPEIATIINFDVPEDPQSYIHRVGRTGRAGRQGRAYTLLSPRNASFAEMLLKHFLETGIEPPENLIEFVDKTTNIDNKAKNRRFDMDF